MSPELAYLLGVATGMLMSVPFALFLLILLERATRRLDGVSRHVRRL